ncbi:phosphopantetheine adenylyltransferase [Candidatus Micrarchaeum sp.]|uniref:pantetheine-phosphate adenylyltransferase n=1 Tax=Candidatus Micrarchaeum sp. TaxID=2282148 RepID=UPI000B653A62|nr:pantetheine-phosphate adenylyltransferase [Candidatus Micrarchaeum sp.]OWP54009.1 MAG: pantetheine-phosphate adenylyltransferase [Thermoplasmatales archaeon ARMAN]QRF73594.1 phosphopantetheine adenylyltransferase [Candidatus Micrarchaeum sp.]
MTGKKIGVYAGSFDPPTNGHLWMISKAAKIFDKLIVAIGINSDKKYAFSVENRVRMLKSITKGMENIEVTSFKDMFLVDFAKKEGANFIVRGIRDLKDFEYEKSIRSVNEDIEAVILTVFLMPPSKLSAVSSSLVKGLVGNKNWENIVSKYVPGAVLTELRLHHIDTGGSGAFSGNE